MRCENSRVVQLEQLSWGARWRALVQHVEPEPTAGGVCCVWFPIVSRHFLQLCDSQDGGIADAQLSTVFQGRQEYSHSLADNLWLSMDACRTICGEE